jgi:hypothetical protein
MGKIISLPQSLLRCILFITMMLHSANEAIGLHFDLVWAYLRRYKPSYDVWTGNGFPASIVEHLSFTVRNEQSR